MKIVHHSQSVLVIKDRPILIWIIGGTFIMAGLYVLFIILTHKQDDKLMSTLFVGGGCLIGGFIGILTPVVTCIFSKTLETLTLKQQGLLGKKTIEHRLSEIQDIQVESNFDDRIRSRVRVVLISGRCLPLTSYYTSDQTSIQTVASYIRNFLTANFG